MPLTEQISADLKAAMKAGDRVRLETLRTLRAAILEFEKAKAGNVIGPEDEISLLTGAAKKRREAIEQYRLAGREELAEQEEAELRIIETYLPQQLSEEEIAAAVREAVDRSGAAGMQDIGKVMGPLMKELKGRADGAVVQTMVRKHLGGA